MARAWYILLGGDDPYSLSRYIKTNTKPNCRCGTTICAIYAVYGGLHPLSPLSENMLMYIKNAVTTGMVQPKLPYGSKKYVYLRDKI